MKYADLLKKSQSFTYEELLGTDEWKRTRESVLKLDNGKCRKCLSYGTIEKNGKIYDDLSYTKHAHISKYGQSRWRKKYLHVHHRYYIKNRLPWQYEFDCFLTLCDTCHAFYHENEKFLVYEDSTLKKVANMTPCKRCNGSGWFEEFRHIDNGICYECNGFQYYELIEFYKNLGVFW